MSWKIKENFLIPIMVIVMLAAGGCGGGGGGSDPGSFDTTNSILDETFGTDGIVTTPVGSSDDFVNAIALQGDGKILLAGYSHNGLDYDFALVRYHADGTLDTTFGSNGIVTTSVGPSDDLASAIALQEDGKIVVAGFSEEDNVSDDHDFALVRYDADGTLDTTFGSDGIVTTTVGPSDEVVFSIALQEDGKIVVAGSSHNGSDYDFALVRYHAHGTLDTTFGSNGKVMTQVGSSNDLASAIALQEGGKIVVAGSSYRDSLNGSSYDFALVRYHADGTPDNSFDSEGIVTTPVVPSDDYAFAIDLQEDGKIVTAGCSIHESDACFALVHYNNADGTPDTTFGSNGQVSTPVWISDDDYSASTIAFQEDGKILVAGYSDRDSLNGSMHDFALVRFNADGTLDHSFGSDGIVTTQVGLGSGSAIAIAIQEDGKIVAAGFSYNGSDNDFALVRYKNCW